MNLLAQNSASGSTTKSDPRPAPVQGQRVIVPEEQVKSVPAPVAHNISHLVLYSTGAVILLGVAIFAAAHLLVKPKPVIKKD